MTFRTSAAWRENIWLVDRDLGSQSAIVHVLAARYPAARFAVALESRV